MYYSVRSIVVAEWPSSWDSKSGKEEAGSCLIKPNFHWWWSSSSSTEASLSSISSNTYFIFIWRVHWSANWLWYYYMTNWLGLHTFTHDYLLVKYYSMSRVPYCKNVRMSSDLWPPNNPCSPATNWGLSMVSGSEVQVAKLAQMCPVAPSSTQHCTTAPSGG